MEFSFRKRLDAMDAEQLRENADRCARRRNRMEEGLDDSSDAYANEAEYRYSMKLYYVRSGKTDRRGAFND